MKVSISLTEFRIKMKLLIIFTVLLFFSCVYGIDVKCEFGIFSQYNNQYTCELKTSVVNESLSALGKVYGIHKRKTSISRYNNLDVVVFNYYSLFYAKSLLKGVNAIFPNLKTIRCVENGLKSISSENFDGNKNLINVEIRQTPLIEIPENVFQGVPTLEVINLSENQIIEIKRETFKGLKNLKEFAISKNSIEIIPENLFIENMNLQIVDFSKNKIKIVSDNFIGMSANMIKFNFMENYCIDFVSDLNRLKIEQDKTFEKCNSKAILISERKHNEINTEIKNLKLNETKWSHFYQEKDQEYQKLNDFVNKIKINLTSCEDDVFELNQNLTSLEQRFEESNEKISESDKKIIDLTKENETLNTKITNCEQQKVLFQQYDAKCKIIVNEKSEKIKEVLIENQELNFLIDEVRSNLTTCEDKMSDLNQNFTFLEQKFEESNDNITNLEAKIEERDDEIFISYEKLDQHKRECDKLSNTIVNLTLEIQSMNTTMIARDYESDSLVSNFHYDKINFLIPYCILIVLLLMSNIYCCITKSKKTSKYPEKSFEDTDTLEMK